MSKLQAQVGNLRYPFQLAKPYTILCQLLLFSRRIWGGRSSPHQSINPIIHQSFSFLAAAPLRWEISGVSRRKEITFTTCLGLLASSFVARSLQIHADMCLARASLADKIPAASCKGYFFTAP
jgi:hypothetical protein